MSDHDELIAASAKIASTVLDVLDDPQMGVLHNDVAQALYEYGCRLRDAGLGPREVLNQLIGIATCTFCDSDLKDGFNA